MQAQHRDQRHQDRPVGAPEVDEDDREQRRGDRHGDAAEQLRAASARALGAPRRLALRHGTTSRTLGRGCLAVDRGAVLPIGLGVEIAIEAVVGEPRLRGGARLGSGLPLRRALAACGTQLRVVVGAGGH